MPKSPPAAGSKRSVRPACCFYQRHSRAGNAGAAFSVGLFAASASHFTGPFSRLQTGAVIFSKYPEFSLAFFCKLA